MCQKIYKLININFYFFHVSGAEDDVHRFMGNDTHTDYFRLVMRDSDSLIVGGR